MNTQAFDFGSGFVQMGSKQKQKEDDGGLLTSDVDTTPPFASVMEAVSRFGGIGFWRPHPHNPTQPSQTSKEQLIDHLQNDPATEKRETLKATRTILEEIKAELQKEANIHRSDKPNDEVPVELTENEILKRVKEATEDVKHCTRVLEEVLRRVEAARNGTYLDSDALVMSTPVISIGQILNRKLILAGERPEKSCMRWKVSWAEILGKGSDNGEKRGGGGGDEKGVPAKRMKLGFGCGGEKGAPTKRMKLGFGCGGEKGAPTKRMKFGFGGSGGGEKGVPAKRKKLRFGAISFMVGKKKAWKQSR